ncbi:hypothetical protein [Streptomyces showdoensis]|uniref:Uncharacterized protein n=1 Tax=Streptomyces showdoensis TaxID=68268 RepID=A0A2P2GTN2_STREW|nr:hypothetical protein [Streptomyces showdoensis]KKZ74857.1 hypothetical protein VO63_05250 [Streptomyces showdoensis]
MTAAWQTINGVPWTTNSASTRWNADGGWKLEYTAIDGVDGWYLSGPDVDRRWMSIQFVESARNAAELVRAGTPGAAS